MNIPRILMYDGTLKDRSLLKVGLKAVTPTIVCDYVDFKFEGDQTRYLDENFIVRNSLT